MSAEATQWVEVLGVIGGLVLAGFVYGHISGARIDRQIREAESRREDER